MSWLKIDDGFGEHEKIIDLTDRSFRLHVVGLCYCARNLTDGILKQRQVAAVCAITNASRRNLVELVSAGLWDEHGKDGYRINDYLEYNPSKTTVKERRRQRSEAGRVGGQRSGEARAQANAQAKNEANASANGQASGLNPVPSRTRKSTSASIGETIERSLRSVP